MRIIKVALNAGALSKKQGVEKGPKAIAERLGKFYMSESGIIPHFEMIDVEMDNSNLEECHSSIFDAAIKHKGHSVFLGGDHSMTYPCFKAFSHVNPGAGMIVFDAHPDLQDNQHPPTHEDYLRVLIEEGTLDSENVILVGARNMSKEEQTFLEARKIKNYSMREIGFEGTREVTDSIMSVARQWSKVYISVDIDVLDAAFAPGTGYPEPGGLTPRELIYMIQRLKILKNIGMADLVEVNPEKDRDGLTVDIAAKLVIEMG